MAAKDFGTMERDFPCQSKRTLIRVTSKRFMLPSTSGKHASQGSMVFSPRSWIGVDADHAGNVQGLPRTTNTGRSAYGHLLNSVGQVHFHCGTANADRARRIE